MGWPIKDPRIASALMILLGGSLFCLVRRRRKLEFGEKPHASNNGNNLMVGPGRGNFASKSQTKLQRPQKGIGRKAIAALPSDAWRRPAPVQVGSVPSARITQARQNSRWAFKDVLKEASTLRTAAAKSKHRPSSVTHFWRDPEFPADNSSLFRNPCSPPSDWLRDGERGGILRNDEVVWRGPEAFCAAKRPLGTRPDGTPTWLYANSDGDGVDSALDVKGTVVCQGSLGDCYLLSALSAAVRDLALCDDLIDEEFEDVGIYGVSLWVKGRWEMVWVDRAFPCYISARSSHSARTHLIFASCSNHKEIWPLVVEKAYAKLHGSYEDLSGGRIAEALCALTGGHGAVLELQSETRDDNAIWALLDRHSFGQDGLSFVGAGSLHHLEEPEAQGVIAGHAYTVLHVLQMEDANGSLRLVKLRNPWGRGEWKGAWSDGHRSWRSETGRRMVAKAQQEAKDDGEFWIAWPDFLARFQTLDFCDVSPDGGREVRLVALRKALAVAGEHQEIKDGVADMRSIDDLLADIEGPKDIKKHRKESGGKLGKGKIGKKK